MEMKHEKHSMRRAKGGFMKPRVMQLVVSLRLGGAESLALNILRNGKAEFDGIVCGLFGEPDKLALAAEQDGFTWLAVCARQGGRGRLGAIRKLYRLLKKEQVSLLHAQSAWLLPYALPAAWLAGVPVVYTEHALNSLRKIAWLRHFVKLSAPFLHGIVGVNDLVRDYFVSDLGISGKRVAVISNGIDTGVFSPDGSKAGLPWPENPAILFVFGNVARLNEAKNHAGLLRAFKLVHDAHPEARLLLVGDGEERETLEKLRRDLDITGAVHITGLCLNIPEQLRSMDAFVLSSRREGLPMALLEAMAAGRPCISTRVGSVPSINEGEDRLMLVPAEDDEALAAAMRDMLDSSARRETLAERGIEYARREYDMRRMGDEYIKLYRTSGRLK
jgi:glycosyltransferase involved in cell wall biosynthesis